MGRWDITGFKKMGKTNSDGSYDERFKGAKKLNSKRRRTAFIIGLIITIILFVGFIICGSDDLATDFCIAALLGLIVGGWSNHFLKKFNKFKSKF